MARGRAHRNGRLTAKMAVMAAALQSCRPIAASAACTSQNSACQGRGGSRRQRGASVSQAQMQRQPLLGPRGIASDRASPGREDARAAQQAQRARETDSSRWRQRRDGHPDREALGAPAPGRTGVAGVLYPAPVVGRPVSAHHGGPRDSRVNSPSTALGPPVLL